MVSIKCPVVKQTIWGSEPDFLYPADIHSSNFRAGTSTLATHNGQPIGFLFGFYKFQGSELPEEWVSRFQGAFRIESQLMVVLPEVRNKGVGFLLKKLQAENALREGIRIINWTVDPLQFGNAVLSGR